MQNSNSGPPIVELVAKQPSRQCYDYIIVGAGAAGCILASQLIRYQAGTVLLVESGKQSTSRSLKVPSEYPRAFGGPMDWNYRTIPQPHLANRSMPLPAGRTPGGSTALNAMIYIEAHERDFEFWGGSNSVWKYEQVQREYQELIARINFADSQVDLHEPLPSRPTLQPSLRQFLDGAHQDGWTATQYPNGFQRPIRGIDVYQRLQRNGRRFAAWQILAQLIRTENTRNAFDIVADCHVERVELRGERASHLIATRSGEQLAIEAVHGIILCSGAVESPRLLMQSGIGPADELKSVGINCVRDARLVGKNLQDHLIFPVIYQLRQGDPFPIRATRSQRTEYWKSRSGVRQSNIAEVGGFFDRYESNPFAGPESEPPEFQWHITPTHYFDYPNRSSDSPYLSVGVTLLRPRSCGEIRIRPTKSSPTLYDRNLNPLQLELDPKYMDDRYDADALVAAVQTTRRLLREGTCAKWIADEVLPGGKREADDQVLSLIRRLGTTLYHYVGTCAISDHITGTCDLQFKVRGIENLWVCDGSAIPNQISGNPQATIMMMAYRLGKWIVGAS